MVKFNQSLVMRLKKGELVLTTESVQSQPLSTLLDFKLDTGIDLTDIDIWSSHIGYDSSENKIIYYRGYIFTGSGGRQSISMDVTNFDVMVGSTPILNKVMSGKTGINISSLGELTIKERKHITKALGVDDSELLKLYEDNRNNNFSFSPSSTPIGILTSEGIQAEYLLDEVHKAPVYKQALEKVKVENQ